MAPGDLGRVIGRQGRTAAAMRTLVSADGGTRRRQGDVLEFRDDAGSDRSAAGAAAVNGRISCSSAVARAHGNRGQVIVNLETDFPEERFTVGEVLLVGAARRGARDPGSPVSSGPTGDRARQASSTMDDAEALAGADLKVPASTVPPLPGGHVLPPRSRRLRGARRATDGRSARVTAVEGPLERSRLVVSRRSRREC